MINYILGGLIIGLTVYFIFRYIRSMKKGGCGCGQDCTGCGSQRQVNK